MKKGIILLLLVAFTGHVMAQSSAPLEVKLSENIGCGFQQMFDKSHVSYNDLIKSYKALNAQRAKAARTTDDTTIYDIPIVFHIVYNNPAWNIPDSVITNQVDILNKAYRKQHADTGLVRSFFKPLSGDAHIQFHLATVDPNGNPTTGIVRVSTTHAYFGTANFSADIDSLGRVKHTSEGGDDPWPSAHYFNVWVCNMSDSAGQLSILGYGVPPLDPLPPNWPAGDAAGLASYGDGVVIQVHAVGSNSSLNAALGGIYTKGRALVHESGHYLGLQHVFGGSAGDSATSICSSVDDDGIDDTPEQCTNSFDAASGTSCPPDTKNSCGAGTAGDLPDMWEDYMDYAHDACQTMFTNDQIAIMRGVLSAQRDSLVTPATTAVNNVIASNTFTVYPNPAAHTINIQYTGNVRTVVIRNMIGQVMMKSEGAQANQKIYDISNFPAGNYFISVESDGASANSRFTVLK